MTAATSTGHNAGLPPPHLLGAPAKFTEWRSQQESALLYPIESEQRFTLQGMPTGFGKSLTYVGRALLTGRRTCVLTVTKGLQQQNMDDFKASGMVDVRGQSSYPCIALAYGLFGDPIRAGCDEGPCHHGAACKFRKEGCGYFDAYDAANTAPLVVTNYAYWLNINAYKEGGMGEFDELILDEAHEAVNQLASFLAIDVERFEVEGILTSRFPNPSMDDWREWARVQRPRCQALYDGLKEEYQEAIAEGGRAPASLRREIRTVSALRLKLIRIAALKGRWLVVPRRTSVSLQPVWVAPYAEEYLFRGVPHINLVSATLRPKAAQLLGITDYDFKEYPSAFPVRRRPVMHVPTVKLTHKSSIEDRGKWVARIDQIIGGRRDRKGIIHTVSYSRQKEILERSHYCDLMMVNTTGNTLGVVEKFKEATAPCVLVSPALSTGWDFPYAECEYQIIAKIPFPDSSDPIVAARSRDDEDYAGYVAMMALVQMAGRGMRAADDQCEVFIVDDNAKWFMWKYRKFAPFWFTQAVKWLKVLPPVPPRIGADLVRQH